MMCFLFLFPAEGRFRALLSGLDPAAPFQLSRILYVRMGMPIRNYC